MNKYICLFFILISAIFFPLNVVSQDNILTAGFQFKPIFSSKFLDTGAQTKDSSGVNFTLNPNSGYCFGMIIRYGISNRVSIESGINYVKRNNGIMIVDSSFTGESDFSIIGYEIPLSGLVFIQLGEKMFMDVSLGASFDFFPSDVQSGDYYFEHFGRRKNWIFTSVLANIGWEYRTEKSGYFYLGASYHRPFRDIYVSTVVYKPDATSSECKECQQFLLSGNYLTVDFRYFFHEDPLKKKTRTKKNKESVE